MVKKLSYRDREKLLEAREQDLTDAELKSRFGIRDDRTLKRHLKLAEQEHEAKLVKVEILKDALSAHLAEIRALVERWKSSLKTPPPGGIYFNMQHPTATVESDPLFGCLRQHLPFPTLWRDYSIWANKVQDHIQDRQKLMKEIAGEAKGSVSEGILNQWGTESMTKALRLTGPLSQMMTKYKQSAESDMQLKRLLGELKALEAKLHDSLQEILLRRDYIMYTCKLCPGQPRLPR
jgi:hypothetical protein